MRAAEERGKRCEVVLDGFDREQGETRGAGVVADEELSQVVVNGLAFLRHLKNAGADDGDARLSKAAPDKGGAGCGVCEEIILWNRPDKVMQGLASVF